MGAGALGNAEWPLRPAPPTLKDKMVKLNVGQAQWERIFGRPVPLTLLPVMVEQAAVKPPQSLPAIHDDRLYTGFCWGLGVQLRGRTHRREVMKRKGAMEA